MALPLREEKFTKATKTCQNNSVDRNTLKFLLQKLALLINPREFGILTYLSNRIFRSDFKYFTNGFIIKKREIHKNDQTNKIYPELLVNPQTSVLDLIGETDGSDESDSKTDEPVDINSTSKFSSQEQWKKKISICRKSTFSMPFKRPFTISRIAPVDRESAV